MFDVFTHSYAVPVGPPGVYFYSKKEKNLKAFDVNKALASQRDVMPKQTILQVEVCKVDRGEERQLIYEKKKIFHWNFPLSIFSIFPRLCLFFFLPRPLSGYEMEGKKVSIEKEEKV